MTIRSLLILPLLLLGCDSVITPRSPRSVSLDVVRSSYELGEIAEARLRNGSDGPIGYNFCLAMWDYLEDGEWQRVAPLRMCAETISVLHRGEEALLREAVDDVWRSGTYRFVLDFNRMGPNGGSATVVSEPFEVRD